MSEPRISDERLTEIACGIDWHFDRPGDGAEFEGLALDLQDARTQIAELQGQTRWRDVRAF